MGIRGVDVLLEEFLVYLAHHLAGFHRNLHLLREVLALFVDEELQAVVFLAQVLKQYLLWLAVGALHVIDKELGEVACHYPSRMLGYGHADNIAACLLEGVEQRAVTLTDGCPQVFAQRFLLYQHTGGWYAAVDEV